MSAPQLLTAGQVDPGLLDAFLRQVYPPLKSAFLDKHGAWWHGSKANRLVVQIEGRIAGYCAVIPTRTWIAGQVHPALWWADLIIDPEYRGRGLQTLFDEQVREMCDLLLGFPNELAATIHSKHGWGVRGDLQILLMPLWPPQVKPVRSASGWRGMFIQGGAQLLRPLVAAWRLQLAARQPGRAWKLDRLDPGALAEIFMRAHCHNLNTTWRDGAYFDWRYGSAPLPQEYNYYLAGPPTAPSHYLIARHLTQPDGLRFSRILDVFGDFSDTVALHDLLILAVQDAIAHGSGQATLLTAQPELRRIAQRLGFLLSAPVGFCWRSGSPEIMNALTGENYWTLGDSDNDAPD